MNMNTIAKLALTASVALVFSACEHKGMRPYGKRKTGGNPNPAPKVQTLDECPAADGSWTLEGGTTVHFDRQEGILTMQHPDLTEVLVFDGKTRDIKQTVTGVTPKVTASCKNKLLLISYKFAAKTVAQSWNIDLEKDTIGITEMDGLTKKSLSGSRVYSAPAAPQGANAPDGF